MKLFGAINSRGVYFKRYFKRNPVPGRPTRTTHARKTAEFIKKSSPLDPKYADDDGTVLLPGEYDEKMRRFAELHGVILGVNVWKELQDVARMLDVQIDHIKPLEYLAA